MVVLLAGLLVASLATPFKTQVSAAPQAARPVVDTARFVAQVGAAGYAFYQLV
jgi:hypothetical protein